MSARIILTKQAANDSQLLSELRSAISNESLDDGLTRSVRILKRISEHYDWLGIYLVKDDSLVLAAYAGEGETEHVRIPIGQGICGLAAKQAETIIVPDVNKDPRYMMCFPSTRSEIVVPIQGTRGGVIGEIDIDSNRLSAFTRKDQDILEQAAIILGKYLETKRFSPVSSKT
jgi:L-methionine (R)-S-oxide reductase